MKLSVKSDKLSTIVTGAAKGGADCSYLFLIRIMVNGIILYLLGLVLHYPKGKIILTGIYTILP